jgi:hypothetical protein
LTAKTITTDSILAQEAAALKQHNYTSARPAVLLVEDIVRCDYCLVAQQVGEVRHGQGQFRYSLSAVLRAETFTSARKADEHSRRIRGVLAVLAVACAQNADWIRGRFNDAQVAALRQRATRLTVDQRAWATQQLQALPSSSASQLALLET